MVGKSHKKSPKYRERSSQDSPYVVSPNSWRWGSGGLGEQDFQHPLGHGLTFRGDTNPVEVASQLLGYVGLTPGWEANHDNHCWGVGQLWPTGWKEK